jgi:APA family basic amino acid/polyamine antiporter
VSEAPSLQRSLRLPQTTALVVGIIIGASIFVQPSEITRQIPSVTGILLAWLAAGALTICGALVCAELASAFPHSGGVYVYLNEAYSPALGFLWGWAMFWSMHSGIIAAIAVVFARYLAVFVPIEAFGQHCVAVGVIALLTAVNYVGVTHGGRVQTIFTAFKLTAIVLLIIAGLTLAPAAVHSTSVALGSIGIRPFVLGIGAGLFAFGGWHMVTYAAGETVDPSRTIPRALLIGTLIVTACYAGLNAIYLRVLPLDAVRSSTRVAADAASVLLGSGGAGLVTGLVLISTFGALNGIVLSGPRVYFAMAERGVIFRGLGAVHPRFRTPSRAILLQGVWSAALAWMSSYRELFSRVVYTEWVFFALLAMGLILLRRRADYRPAYRVWGYPVVPIVFAVASLYIAITQLAADPRSGAMGCALVLAGLPVYYLWARPGVASA